MSSNLPLGAEHDSNAPYNEKEEYECPECGNPVEKEGQLCSGTCFEASMI